MGRLHDSSPFCHCRQNIQQLISDLIDGGVLEVIISITRRSVEWGRIDQVIIMKEGKRL